MRAISLFSGAGGMDFGFKKAGFKIIIANEMDQNASKTFSENHPEVKMLTGDIRSHSEEIYAQKNIDIVFGGPPCQGFSVAGKMDVNDERSSLVFDFCEAIENIRPKSFVMENVKSLAAVAKFSRFKDEIINRLEDAGYRVQVIIANAKNYGVPQSRERVFFIGLRKDLYPNQLIDLSVFEKKAPTLRELLKPMGRPGSKTNKRPCTAIITPAKNPVLRKSPFAGMLFNGQGRAMDLDGVSNTLPASMGGNRTPIIDNASLYMNLPQWIKGYHKHLMSGGDVLCASMMTKRLRRLTIDEAAAIQTFPADYIWVGSDSSVFSQIGNAVPCLLAEVVARSVMKVVEEK